MQLNARRCSAIRTWCSSARRHGDAAVGVRRTFKFLFMVSIFFSMISLQPSPFEESLSQLTHRELLALSFRCGESPRRSRVLSSSNSRKATGFKLRRYWASDGGNVLFSASSRWQKIDPSRSGAFIPTAGCSVKAAGMRRYEHTCFARMVLVGGWAVRCS